MMFRALQRTQDMIPNFKALLIFDEQEGRQNMCTKHSDTRPTLPQPPRGWYGRKETISGKVRKELAEEDIFELGFEEK